MSDELNEPQRQAVQANEGPVLVIAGAGSGKTRVLTERIVHLVRDRNVPPWNILAFTFTNRAAREMKERLETRRPGIAERLWVGTFHATGVRILRSHGESIGVDRNFSIYDADDSLSLVKVVISQRALEGGMFRSPRSVRDRISRWKNDLITPKMAFDNAVTNLDKRMVEIYRDYEKGLRRANALDFDDLIARVVELFELDADVKEHYARRFRYVLVDEFQDTNPIQMALIDGVSSVHKNLFVVGDDDQSIYSWRGAKVDHILNFESLYPGTVVIRLEQNYRSTQTILDAANHVIANNLGRKGKNLWTAGESGDKLTLLHAIDEQSEALNVLHAVKSLVQGGFDLRDIAVLYRTNAQSRALEDVLKLGSLPYQIIGSVGFYERAEVRDILAYCKLVVNPADDVNLKRILNVPRRALGKTTYERLAAQAAFRDTSILRVLRSGHFDLAGAQTRHCGDFVRLLDKLTAIADTQDAPGVIEAIVDQVRYRDHLHDNYPDGDSRVENVEELVAAAATFAENSENHSLQAFLEEIALVADVDALDKSRGQLTLMTLHNAKGLEFDCVFVTGLEEGLFPHINSIDDPDALEEERRLFYVGMTRARKRLFCSYARMRRRMGVVEGGMPSRFLFEIPQAMLDGAVETLAPHSDVPGDFDDHDRLAEGGGRGYASAHKEFEEYSQEELLYFVGMRIHHDNFGRGVVRRVEGSGERLRVTVIFDGGGERKFLAHYAPMKPLG